MAIAVDGVSASAGAARGRRPIRSLDGGASVTSVGGDRYSSLTTPAVIRGGSRWASTRTPFGTPNGRSVDSPASLTGFLAASTRSEAADPGPSNGWSAASQVAPTNHPFISSVNHPPGPPAATAKRAAGALAPTPIPTPGNVKDQEIKQSTACTSSHSTFLRKCTHSYYAIIRYAGSAACR